MIALRISLFIIFSLLLSACATTTNKTPAVKKKIIISMKNETLSDLYKRKPETKSLINNSKGYAVFSNANVNLILASFGGGYGVVKDNSNGHFTFMNMGEVGIGFGLGVKDFRLIFVFHTRKSLQRFINHGWAFGGQADVAAKVGDKGDAIGKEVTIDDITIYQITKSGLALQATIKGTKFWKADDLN